MPKCGATNHTHDQGLQAQARQAYFHLLDRLHMHLAKGPTANLQGNPAQSCSNLEHMLVGECTKAGGYRTPVCGLAEVSNSTAMVLRSP